MAQHEYGYVSYEEYEKHAETQRSEWIDGVIYDMSGTHGNHGLVVVRLRAALERHVQGKPCKVYPETVELQFFEGEDRIATVQPDLKVVCGRDKMKNGVIIAAPTLIVEVLSPSTSSYDCITKRNLYQQHGVLEYWIVSWEEHAVTISSLIDGVYSDERLTIGTAQSKVLPGFSIDLAVLFDDLDEP